MKIRRILSGILAAGIIAASAAAPEILPLNGVVITAEAASSVKAPTGFSVKSSSAGKVKLSWDKLSGADGVEVYRATSKDGKYKSVKTVSGKTGVSFSLNEGKTYYFKLRAYKKSGSKKNYSDYTSAKKVTVLSAKQEEIAALKKKAPLLAAYFETVAGGFPMTCDLEIASKKGNIIEDYQFENYGSVSRVAMSVESMDKFAVTLFLENKSEMTVYINGSTGYIISSADKTAMRMKVSANDKKQLIDAFGKLNEIEVPDISSKYIKVKTGNKKYDGKDCLYEKIYGDGVDNVSIETYADKSTKMPVCVDIKIMESSVTYKIRKLSKTADKNMFKVPSGYKVIDV